MMDYKEMAAIVKERGDAIIAEKAEHTRRIRKVSVTVSGIAASAAAAFCIWHLKDSAKFINTSPDNINIIEDITEPVTSPTAEKAAAVLSTTASHSSAAASVTKAGSTAVSSADVSSSETARSSDKASASYTAVDSIITSAAVQTEFVPVETTEAVTTYDNEQLLSEGRIIMKRFAALSTALLMLPNVSAANAAAAEPLKYTRTDKYPDYIQNLITCIEDYDLDIDINDDGKFDIFDAYAVERNCSDELPEYIVNNINACEEKINEFKQATGLNANICDITEYFVRTQPVKLEYFDPNYYIDNCPDTYNEPVDAASNGGYLSEDTAAKARALTDYSSNDFNPARVKNSRMSSAILEDMVKHPIDTTALNAQRLESASGNLNENMDRFSKMVAGAKMVDRRANELDGKSQPRRQVTESAGGSGIDYALIKTIVNECIETKFNEMSQRGLLNEGTTIKGIGLSNGKIKLVDNKGNVFSAKLEYQGNTKDKK
jgi:hypothetical protein